MVLSLLGAFRLALDEPQRGRQTGSCAFPVFTAPLTHISQLFEAGERRFHVPARARERLPLRRVPLRLGQGGFVR